MIVFCYKLKDHENFVYEYPEIVFKVVNKLEALKISIGNIL